MTFEHDNEGGGDNLLRRRNKPSAIGLDIGSTFVRAIQLVDAAGAPTVHAAAQSPIDLGRAGSSDSEAAVTHAIREVLASAPFHGNQVVTALGTSEVQLKNLRLPRMPAEEMKDAVLFEALARFEADSDDFQIQYVQVGEVRHGNEQKEEVVAFAATNECIGRKLDLLESLKLTPIAIDLTPCAVARSFVRFLRRTEDENSVNVFLEIGYLATTIIVTRGADISFIKVVDIGGQQFNDAVARTLDIAKGEAADLRIRLMESIRRNDGTSGGVPPEIASAIGDALRPLIERLCREVQLCLRYFAVTFRGGRPESLTVVGGESGEPRVVELLSELIDVPCTIGHPLRGMLGLDRVGGRERRVFQPAWAVAGGLALRDTRWVGGGAKRSSLRSALSLQGA